MDFKEVWYDSGKGRACLIRISDHDTKLVLGCAVGPRRSTELASQALWPARRTLSEIGRDLGGRICTRTKTGSSPATAGCEPC